MTIKLHCLDTLIYPQNEYQYLKNGEKMQFGPYVEHIFGERVQEMYRSHNGWMTCSIHHSIPWPRKDVLIKYDNQDYFLRGIAEREDFSSPCISVYISAEQTIHELKEKLYKFTSILGWFQNGYADITGFSQSGGYPILSENGRAMFIPTVIGGDATFNCNYMPVLANGNEQIALAFYREGLKLQHIHEGYAFLSFFKVLESQLRSPERVEWINASLNELEDRSLRRYEELIEEGIEDVGRHIYNSGRCAIAHASLNGEYINPDIPEDKERISKDLVLIHFLAKKFIKQKLQIADSLDVYKYRNNLFPLEQYIDSYYLNLLKEGGRIEISFFNLELDISLSHWPHGVIPELAVMKLKLFSMSNGKIIIHVWDEENTLRIRFDLDFTEGKIYASLEIGTIPNENQLTLLKYQRILLSNGTIEIIFPCGNLLTCESFMPVNIHPDALMEVDRLINQLEESLCLI